VERWSSRRPELFIALWWYFTRLMSRWSTTLCANRREISTRRRSMSYVVKFRINWTYPLLYRHCLYEGIRLSIVTSHNGWQLNNSVDISELIEPKRCDCHENQTVLKLVCDSSANYSFFNGTPFSWAFVYIYMWSSKVVSSFNTEIKYLGIRTNAEMMPFNNSWNRLNFWELWPVSHNNALPHFTQY
jgi:hypothetical protein